VQEQYDDNIFLSETNEQDDLITTVSPGVDLKYESPTELIDIDYEFQESIFRDRSEFNYSGHRGRVEARKDFGPRLSASIREVFISSEEPIEDTGIPVFERPIVERPSIRIGRRSAYTRNTVQPGLTFRFGETRSIRLGYRNNTLMNERDDIADREQNAINGLLTSPFNIHNSIEVFCEYINQDYDPTTPPRPSRDFHGDEIRGRYTYHFDPITSAFIEYRYYERDFDPETTDLVDYQVHDRRLGFSRDLDENVSVSASAGHVLRSAHGRDDETSFSGRLDFSGQYKRLSADLYGETGFDEDFLSAETLGFNEFCRVSFNGRYQLLERLSAQGLFYLQRDRFVDHDRRDKLWNIRGRLSYELLGWLFLSFDYEHNKRDSNIAVERYRDNRYFFRVTTQYDIAELFQR
jgi:hypothetical protein